VSAPRVESSLTVTGNGVGFFAVPGWRNFDWLWHGFSTRIGGVSRVYLPDPEAEHAPGELNLGYTALDKRENVLENRSRLVEAVTGSRETPLATLRQVHSRISVVLERGEETDFAISREADGILTNRSGVLLGVQTADCIPVLVADPVARAVGAFHAGWRGTVERIVELGVGRMVEEFGSDPGNLVAAIGPGIGACCYTVGGEVRARFENGFSYSEELFSQSSDDLRLNLIEANRRQLLAAGVTADAISVVGGCTSCQPELFYSHRASGGHAGRMMAVIGIP